MILMQAPAPNLTFGALPSGASYVSDQDGLIHIANNSVADQSALAAAGCYMLSPFGGWGTFSFNLLTDMYAADTGAILPGITGFPQHTTCQVLNDPTPANNGSWIKTASGSGAGNWTYSPLFALSGAAVATAQAGVATTEAGIATSQAVIATTQAGLSASSSATAIAQAIVAGLAAQQAQAAAGIINILTAAPVALPYEVTAISGGVGTGSGGTPGTYIGGATTAAPQGFQWSYTIDATGKLALPIVILNPGIAVTNSVPTLAFATGTGLTGATVPTATVAAIPVNRTFYAPSSDGNSLLAWGNNGGALASSPFGATQASIPLTSYIASVLATAQASATSVSVDFTKPSFGAPILGNYDASPATRFSYSVDGFGALNLTFIQGTYFYIGYRTVAPSKIGRAFNSYHVLSATNWTAQLAPAVGWDTGTGATATSNALYLVCRAGTVLLETCLTGATGSTAGYTVTKLSGAYPADAAAWSGVTSYVEQPINASGQRNANVTFNDTTNNVSVTVNIAPLPPGNMCFMLRGLGSGSSGGANQSGKLVALGWNDAGVGFWTGVGAPPSTTGNNGDYYMQLASVGGTATAIWGPKAAGAWPTSGVPFAGPQGPVGPTGPGAGAELAFRAHQRLQLVRHRFSGVRGQHPRIGDHQVAHDRCRRQL